MKSFTKKSVKGKRVIVRTDYNVPIADNVIMDDTRIRESLPTIKTLLENGASQVLLMSHLGRPKGKQAEFRMDPVGKRLSKLLEVKVEKLDDCVDVVPKAKIVLLENLRFHPEEEKNGIRFAKRLASLADVYVNDAFSVSHRKHASIHSITKFLPSYAGLSLEKEVEILELIRKKPEKPFIVILGGAKISTKLPLIRALLPKVSKILLGGAMIFTFYKALGYNIGNSLHEKKYEFECLELIKSSKIILPRTVVCSEDLNGKSRVRNYELNAIPKGVYGVDVAEESIKEFEFLMDKAKLVFWNGPMGIFEIRKFSKGTSEIAKFLAEHPSKVIIGGGDTASAVNSLNLAHKYYHVSTGGGALLEFISSKKLPGLEALKT